MVTELFTEKSHHIRNWMWKQRYERAFSSHSGMLGDGSQLHFLLGVRGGGVDHLGRMLSRPSVKLRYFNNVLSRVEPRLNFNRGGDRLAMPFEKSLEHDHPMFRVFRMLVEFDNDWALEKTTNRVQSKAPESLPCLVKENSSLLATEALLRETQGRALLYISDPVKIVDTLFAEERLDTPYLVEETKSVLSPMFLHRFMRRDYTQILRTHREINRKYHIRERIILTKVLTVALIHHMFRMLAIRYPEQLTLVEYSRLANDPYVLEDAINRSFGEQGPQIAREVVSSCTFNAEGHDSLLWKNAWPEHNGKPRYLTAKDAQLCYAALADSGLGTRLSGKSRYRPTSESLPGVASDFSDTIRTGSH